LVDTIAFGEPIGLSSIADIDVSWRATSSPVKRGLGTSVEPDKPGAFEGEFSDAVAHGSAVAKRTGFSFRAHSLDSKGFFAEIGHEVNGSFLS
jgi:hypothetical protein